MSRDLLQYVVEIRNDYIFKKVEFKKFKSKLSLKKTQLENLNIFPAWEGYRNFVVSKKIIENSNCASIYLSPEDNLDLHQPLAGQYLAIRYQDNENIFKKKYSISSFDSKKHYRITIKKSGIFSQYLFDTLSLNEKIQCKMPAGDFILEYNNDTSVLIAAGIGITPILAMLEQIASTRPEHKTHLFWAVSSLGDVILSEDFERLSSRINNLSMHLFISQSNKQQNRVSEPIEHPYIENNKIKYTLDSSEQTIGSNKNAILYIENNKTVELSVFKKKDQWFIKDLGSESEVYLNKKIISGPKASWRSFLIKNGDRILIDNNVFTFINPADVVQKKEEIGEKRDKLNIKNFTLHKGRMTKERVMDFIEETNFDCYLSVPASMVIEFSDIAENVKIESFNASTEHAVFKSNNLNNLH